MLKYKRIISFLLVITLLVGLCSGCKRNTNADIPKPSEPTESTSDGTIEKEQEEIKGAYRIEDIPDNPEEQAIIDSIADVLYSDFNLSTEDAVMLEFTIEDTKDYEETMEEEILKEQANNISVKIKNTEIDEVLNTEIAVSDRIVETGTMEIEVEAPNLSDLIMNISEKNPDFTSDKLKEELKNQIIEGNYEKTTTTVTVDYIKYENGKIEIIDNKEYENILYGGLIETAEELSEKMLEEEMKSENNTLDGTGSNDPSLPDNETSSMSNITEEEIKQFNEQINNESISNLESAFKKYELEWEDFGNWDKEFDFSFGNVSEGEVAHIIAHSSVYPDATFSPKVLHDGYTVYINIVDFAKIIGGTALIQKMNDNNSMTRITLGDGCVPIDSDTIGLFTDVGFDLNWNTAYVVTSPVNSYTLRATDNGRAGINWKWQVVDSGNPTNHEVEEWGNIMNPIEKDGEIYIDLLGATAALGIITTESFDEGINLIVNEITYSKLEYLTYQCVRQNSTLTVPKGETDKTWKVICDVIGDIVANSKYITWATGKYEVKVYEDILLDIMAEPSIDNEHSLYAGTVVFENTLKWCTSEVTAHFADFLDPSLGAVLLKLHEENAIDDNYNPELLKTATGILTRIWAEQNAYNDAKIENVLHAKYVFVDNKHWADKAVVNYWGVSVSDIVEDVYSQKMNGMDWDNYVCVIADEAFAAYLGKTVSVISDTLKMFEQLKEFKFGQLKTQRTMIEFQDIIRKSYNNAKKDKYASDVEKLEYMYNCAMLYAQVTNSYYRQSKGKNMSTDGILMNHPSYNTLKHMGEDFINLCGEEAFSELSIIDDEYLRDHMYKSTDYEFSFEKFYKALGFPDTYKMGEALVADFDNDGENEFVLFVIDPNNIVPDDFAGGWNIDPYVYIYDPSTHVVDTFHEWTGDVHNYSGGEDIIFDVLATKHITDIEIPLIYIGYMGDTLLEYWYWDGEHAQMYMRARSWPYGGTDYSYKVNTDISEQEFKKFKNELEWMDTYYKDYDDISEIIIKNASEDYINRIESDMKNISLAVNNTITQIPGNTIAITSARYNVERIEYGRDSRYLRIYFSAYADQGKGMQPILFYPEVIYDIESNEVKYWLNTGNQYDEEEQRQFMYDQGFWSDIGESQIVQ